MRAHTIRTKAGWIDLLEAAYAPERDDRAWGKRLVEASTAVFGDRDLGLIVLRHSPDCSTVEPLLSVGGSADEFVEPRSLAAVGAAGIRELYYPPSLVATQLEIAARLAPQTREFMKSYREGHGAVDGVGLIVHPEPGVAAALYAGYSRPVALSWHQRKALSQVALHVEAGYRLRLRPEVVKAVISPEGKVLHRERGAPETGLLASRVRRIERSRLRKNRTDPEALALWRALVDGRVSVVERTDGSQRHYLVVENAPTTQPLRALTPGEIDVVSYAARGLSSKLVAYALGISTPTVSAWLSSAARKIGLATRVELVRLAAMLTRDPRARFEKLALTTAERDVLELLSQGLSNRDIARIRNRSVRTIANQVAALLQKTGSPTRRALVTRTIKNN